MGYARHHRYFYRNTNDGPDIVRWEFRFHQGWCDELPQVRWRRRTWYLRLWHWLTHGRP